MKDAFWEVGYTLRKMEADMKRLVDTRVAEAETVQVEAYFDALQAAIDNLGGGGVRCMEVWDGILG